MISKVNVILSEDEIKKDNQIIMKKTDELYDLDSYKKITKEEIREYILKYQLPDINKYSITKEEETEILSNRNIENIEDLSKIPKGIVVKRTNLRSFPTSRNFFIDTGRIKIDSLQETELLVNTGVLILNESLDKEWYFVISPCYRGWVNKQNIALANDNDFNYFINNNDFGVIIEPKVQVGDVILDMSVKLPVFNNLYVIPVKGNDGYVRMKDINISLDQINKGYLLYTRENVIKQAYKYLGTPYSWGGYQENVDCSGFIKNIYGTFGFNFPRNTASQRISVGQVVPLERKKEEDKLKLLQNTEPSLLYQDGHVMLYVGVKNNKNYIIHASGEGMVKDDILENSSYLEKSNKLVLFKK